MESTQKKSKRVLAGMMALLLASGTVPANFGGAAAANTAIEAIMGSTPDGRKPGKRHHGPGFEPKPVHEEENSEKAGSLTSDEDDTKPEQEIISVTEPADVIDEETTDAETTDAETTVEETTDEETTDEETTGEETVVIVIAPEVSIPLGAAVIINSDDHFYDGEGTVRAGDLLNADKVTLEYDSYKVLHGYEFRLDSNKSNDSICIVIQNEDSSLTPVGIKCVSGAGTREDPYKFEAVFQKKEDPKEKPAEEQQIAGNFVKINSIKEATEKMTEISPADAKKWLAANAEDIKAADSYYRGTYDFCFIYEGKFYCKTLNSDQLTAEHIGNANFTWDALSMESKNSIIYQCLGRQDHVLVWNGEEVQQVVTYTKVKAKEPTCTEAGNTEYYTGSDNKYYKLENGVYTEIAKDSWVIKAKGHSYGKPTWTWNDDLTVTAEFTCEECGDVVVIEAEVILSAHVNPTYTSEGKAIYSAKVDFEGVHYSYVRTVTIPKLKLVFVDKTEPTCIEAGNIGYWYDEANNKYFADENGEYEISKADTILEETGHTLSEAVIENNIKPTYFSEGSYDKVYYCSECGEELIREHVIVEKLKYQAPAIKFARGENAVKLTWAEVEDADYYGIAGYVSGRWILLYDNIEDTSFVLNGLTEGKEYWISVVTRSNDRWITDFSNAVVVSPKSTAGNYPVVTAIEHNADTHQFRLKWSEVKGAQQYGIAVYLSGKWKVITQNIPADTTSFTSPKLTAGQTYKIVVCAKVNGKWDTNNLNARAFNVTVQPESPMPEGVYEAEDFQFSGKVYIVGDSTVCNYLPETTQKKGSCGWGMKLAEQFEGVTVTNLARAGRSSRSFMKDNEYKIMCDSIGKGDYLFIQFGHNDERTAEPQHAAYPYLDLDSLDNEGKNENGQYSYEWMLLNKYVRVAQEKGATAVLVTPVTRRDKDGRPLYKEHEKYADAVVQLGKKYNIPVIDMTTKTKDLYNEIYEQGGAEATAELHCYLDETRTEIDNTHLSVKGCELIADIIARETKVLDLKISERLK